MNHTVGKPFLVMRDGLRRCLCCDGLFTRQEAPVLRYRAALHRMRLRRNHASCPLCTSQHAKRSASRNTVG